jgi:hypothetical protein
MDEGLVLEKVKVTPASATGVMNGLLRQRTRGAGKLGASGKSHVEVDSTGGRVEFNVCNLPGWCQPQGHRKERFRDQNTVPPEKMRATLYLGARAG